MMKNFNALQLLAYFVLGTFLLAEEKTVSFSAEEVKIINTLSPLPAVKPDPTNKYSKNTKAIAFGEDLFNDWRFSTGAELFACQTCHRVSDHFMSVRDDTEIDIPTLWNVGYNNWFFWDGRADTLWAQALGPFENPKEHDSNRTEIVSIISRDTKYKEIYEEIFGEIPDFRDYKRFPVPAKPSKENKEANANWQSMTKEDQMQVNKVFANVGKALAAFQMTLVSQKTDFDVFVEGLKENDSEKQKALSEPAKRGLKVFVGKGKCITCHSGPSFSDSAFHDTQLPEIDIDLGFKHARHGGIKTVADDIFNAAGPFSDAPASYLAERLKTLKPHSKNKGQFKTPGLRNIVYTQPYMHTGQFRSLIDVINFYSDMKNASESDHPEIQPRKFTEQEKRDLIAFLESISTFAKD